MDIDETRTDLRRNLIACGNLDFMLRPQQREIKKWLSEHTAPISVIHAARGYGKTWLSLILAIEQGLKRPNQRIIYACPSREQARQIAVPTMWLIQERFGEDLKITQESASHQYRLPNGSVIILEGADDDHGNRLRGPYAHLVICDEAGFWSHCDYAIRSVLFPQIQRTSGRLIAISTSPESIGHEFVALCERTKRTNSYLRRTIDDNQYLTDEERTKFMEELGGVDATAVRRELYCEFVVESTRAVIPEFREQDHVFREMSFLPIHRDRYVALDLGFKDYSHALFAYWDFDRACLVVEDEVVENYSTTKRTADKIHAKEQETWGEHKPYSRIADNDPQIIADLGDNGLDFSATMKTDKEAAINSLRTMFADGKVQVADKCKVLIHQLKVGIWNKGRTDYERMPGAGHLDGIDALVYLNRMIDKNHNPVPRDFYLSASRHFIHPKWEASTNRHKKLLSIVGRK